MSEDSIWTDLPKLELHLHLEGAAPPEFIRQLAGEQGFRLDGVFGEDGGYAYRDFNHFLEVYAAATQVLRTPQDFARLVTAIIENLADEGVIYAESFISPEFCGGGDVAAWRDYIAAMQEAAEQGHARHGVMFKGIATAIRHLGPDKARSAALCAADTHGEFVRGFGMGGDEMAFTPADFAWAYDCARETGMGLTVHAGEWGGAKSVRDALDALRPSRIGHGVQAIDAPDLLERMAEDAIHLEVCPGSNVFLGVYPNLEAHPIERLRAAGVPISISTDDPPFFRTTLSQEYQNLSDTFEWETDRFFEINKMALEAAFCDDDTRTDLAKKLEPSP